MANCYPILPCTISMDSRKALSVNLSQRMIMMTYPWDWMISFNIRYNLQMSKEAYEELEQQLLYNVKEKECQVCENGWKQR